MMSEMMDGCEYFCSTLNSSLENRSKVYGVNMSEYLKGCCCLMVEKQTEQVDISAESLTARQILNFLSISPSTFLQHPK